ncbi:MAG: cytidine deaminase [Caldilineaceae bacterium]|nr:cytidine deaminase [Caldilineaceae bacterium]
MKDTDIQTSLVAAALDARLRAYAPYSKYTVGAAVMDRTGHITSGCNVENASYGATICAERVALTRAIAEGRDGFVGMAVVTSDGGSPCGVCRQVMMELGPEMRVFISDSAGVVRSTSVRQLLPDSFDGSGLLSVQPAPHDFPLND